MKLWKRLFGVFVVAAASGGFAGDSGHVWTAGACFAVATFSGFAVIFVALDASTYR